MIVINGRYLAARRTGVQRVAAALVGEIDQHASREEVERWRLLRPPGAQAAGLARISEVEAGLLSGQLWEQAVLPSRAGAALVLNLCNTAPIISPCNVVMIHDAQVFLSPESYGKVFRRWYAWLLPRIGRSALRVLTVSEFSKRSLVRFGVADAERIEVIPNGCDHLTGPADASVRLRLGIDRLPYVVMMASLQKHKNVDVVFRAFERPELSGVQLVLVGGDDAAAFQAVGRPSPPRAVFAGRLSDAGLRGLLDGALALACPSLTEGFGLPPLEAMSRGCPAVVAPEGALPEVCGDAAVYADAADPEAWAAALAVLLDPLVRARQVELGRERAACFTWEASGRRLLSVLRPLEPGSPLDRKSASGDDRVGPLPRVHG